VELTASFLHRETSYLETSEPKNITETILCTTFNIQNLKNPTIITQDMKTKTSFF